MPLLRRFLPLAGLLAACQSQPAETTPPPAPVAPPLAALVPAPTVAQQLSPIISGYWVSAQYLDAITRTRSPLAAFNHTPPGPASLTIDSFASQKDSLQIGASYGLHEGDNLTLLLPANEHGQALAVKPRYGDEAGTFSQLGYQIAAGDTTLVLISRSRKNSQLRYQITYRRTGRAVVANDMEVAVNRGVNGRLLARHYSGTDSLGQPVQVRFSLDGVVSGLPFKQYVIQTDFTGPTAGDEMIFDVYTKQRQELAASFGRDTLKLYTIHSAIGIPPGETDTTEIFSCGRLRYQLIRVR